MKKLIFILFTLLLSKMSYSQWSIIDTLYSFNQCTLPFPYSVTPVFLSNDSAYYYFNFPNCSPSTTSGYKVYRTSDSFANWINVLDNQNTGGGTGIYDLVFTNNNVGFLSYSNSGVKLFSKTSDAGATWSTISVSTNGPLVADLFFTNGDSGFAVSNSGVLYKYFNDTIHLIDTINFTSCFYPKMFFSANEFGYILAGDIPFTGYHKVLKSPDGGITWSISLLDTNRTFYDISFFTDSIGYLASDTGLYRTNDAGMNWTLVNTPFGNCSSISIVNNNLIFVIGSGGVYQSNDAGLNWSQQSIPTNCNPLSIKMINDSLGFIYAKMISFNYGNLVLKTINGGTVGLSEINSNENILLFQPNPSFGKCIMTLPNDFVNKKNLTLSIYDNNGKLIQQKTIEMNDGKIILNLEAEAKGTYNVTLSNRQKSYNGKIVFQ